MTRRRGRSRVHPAAVILAGTGVLVAADAAVWALWHGWPLILAAVLAWVTGRRYRLHRRVWALLTRPATGPVDRGELAQLRAERDQLAAALADAELARDAAWDAAASVPPRQHRPDVDPVTRLFSDSLSGARPIGANRQSSTSH